MAVDPRLRLYCLNRTFMELKRDMLSAFVLILPSLNRTFMELKQR